MGGRGDIKEEISDDFHQVTLFTCVIFFRSSKHHLIECQAHARIWSMGRGRYVDLSHSKTLDPGTTETVWGCSRETAMAYEADISVNFPIRISSSYWCQSLIASPKSQG